PQSYGIFSCSAACCPPVTCPPWKADRPEAIFSAAKHCRTSKRLLPKVPKGRFRTICIWQKMNPCHKIKVQSANLHAEKVFFGAKSFLNRSQFRNHGFFITS